MQGKNVVLVDDMVDTAEPSPKAADLMMERGAASVRPSVPTPSFQEMPTKNLRKSKLEELIVTDSSHYGKTAQKLKSCQPNSSDVMLRVNENRSISSKFLM